MTRLEALAKGRAIRETKILKKIYESNKELINRDHPVGFTTWLNRIKTNQRDNLAYKEDSLIRAAHRYMHSREYVSAETVGIENIKTALKRAKTGKKIAWGRRTKEETLFDVLRQKTGYFKKTDWYWSEENKAYHVATEEGEYAVISYGSPVEHYLVEVNSDEYRYHLDKKQEFLDKQLANKRRR